MEKTNLGVVWIKKAGIFWGRGTRLVDGCFGLRPVAVLACGCVDIWLMATSILGIWLHR